MQFVNTTYVHIKYICRFLFLCCFYYNKAHYFYSLTISCLHKISWSYSPSNSPQHLTPNVCVCSCTCTWVYVCVYKTLSSISATHTHVWDQSLWQSTSSQKTKKSNSHFPSSYELPRALKLGVGPLEPLLHAGSVSWFDCVRVLFR